MGKVLANNTITILLFAAALVCISIIVLNWAFRSTMDGIEWQERIHEVEKGESLWTISKNYCPEQVDRREWVEEIKALNGLRDSSIYPGQKIIILKKTIKGGNK